MDYDKVNNNVKWVLWSDGVLSLYGSGAASPSGIGAWYKLTQYVGDVTELEIQDGITSFSLGYTLFSGFNNLTTVRLPSSITSFGNTVFSRSSKLTDVYYAGTRTAWQKISFGSGNSYLTSANIHYSADWTIRDDPQLASGSKTKTPWEPLSTNQA